MPPAVIAMCLVVSLAAQTPAGYRITQRFVLGGDGSWDYVVPDPPNHRVFIGRQNRVMVVVVMFDLTTFTPLGRIAAAEDADAIIFDAASNRVFTFNGDAHSSTVIDPVAGARITNLDLGGKPEYGAAAGDGHVYANLTDTNEVVEIEAKTLRVARRWPTAPCRQPVSMAIDPARHRIFSGCRSGVLAVSDAAAGRIVTTLPIGQGVDGAGFDPATGDVFASSADGTLTVIHQDSADVYHVVGRVSTPQGSRNMGLDPTTHRLFVPSATFVPAAAPTPANPRPRPTVVPGSFTLLVIMSDASGASSMPQASPR